MKKSRIIDHMDEILSIPDLLQKCSDVYGSDLTAIYTDNKSGQFSKSYRDLYSDVCAAAAFWNSQVIAGSRIAICGPLNYQWLVMFFGIICSGNVAVPVDRFDNELHNKLVNSKLSGIFYDSSAKQIKNELESIEIPIAVTNQGDDEKTYDQIIEKFHSSEPINVDQDKEAIIVFTSGTTGISKGVVLTHRNIITNAKCGVFYLTGRLYEGDTIIPILPPTHMFQITAGILSPLFYGMTLCIGGGVKTISKDIQLFQPKAMVMVPMIVENMYSKTMIQVKKKISDKKLDRTLKLTNSLSKLGINIRRRVFKEIHASYGGKLDTIICGGAKLDKNVIKGFDSFGITVLEGYGITECSPIISCNTTTHKKIGTIGICAKQYNYDVDIIDGEICVKGDIVFKEYFNDPDATAEAKTEGWFHTGDLGEIDKHGFLSIVGRKKNLIILADGNNISPEELEFHFKELPYVGSMFIGSDEEDKGLVLYIHPDITDFPITQDDAEKFISADVKKLNMSLPPYKRVKDIKFFNEDFEKTALGKIKRFKYIERKRNYVR